MSLNSNEEKNTVTAENGSTGFVPTIVAFCCNWCSYAGADLAGTSRLSYPANVKIIRVPCSCPHLSAEPTALYCAAVTPATATTPPATTIPAAE